MPRAARVSLLEFEGQPRSYGWDGAWPPPEYIALCVGRFSKQGILLALDDDGHPVGAKYGAETSTVTLYRRASHTEATARRSAEYEIAN